MAMSEMILDWYTIYTFSGAFDPKRILPGAKFTFRPSLAFSYIGSITVRYSQCVSQALRRGTRKAADNGVPFFSTPILGRVAIMWYFCGTSSSFRIFFFVVAFGRMNYLHK